MEKILFFNKPSFCQCSFRNIQPAIYTLMLLQKTFIVTHAKNYLFAKKLYTNTTMLKSKTNGKSHWSLHPKVLHLSQKGYVNRQRVFSEGYLPNYNLYLDRYNILTNYMVKHLKRNTINLACGIQIFKTK